MRFTEELMTGEKCKYRIDEYFAMMGDKSWKTDRPDCYAVLSTSHIFVTNFANCLKRLCKIDDSDNISVTFSNYAAKCIKGHFYRNMDTAPKITMMFKKMMQRFRYTGTRHIMDLDDEKSFYIRQYGIPMTSMKFGLIVGLALTDAGREFMNYVDRVDEKLLPFRQIMKCYKFHPIIDGPTDTSFLNPDWNLNETEILRLIHIEKFGKKSKYTQMIVPILNRIFTELTSKSVQRGNKRFPMTKARKNEINKGGFLPSLTFASKGDVCAKTLVDVYPQYLKNHFVEDCNLNDDFREVLNRELLIKLLQK